MIDEFMGTRITPKRLSGKFFVKDGKTRDQCVEWPKNTRFILFPVN